MSSNSKLRLLVLGTGTEASELKNAGHAKENWEVFSGETDRSDMDVVVIGTEGDVDTDWLSTVKISNPECLVLVSRARVADSDAWKEVRHLADDLYDSGAELSERIPFITKRLPVRDARRQKFEAIYEHAVDAIIIIDRKGLIQRFNVAAHDVFGYYSFSYRDLNWLRG